MAKPESVNRAIQEIANAINMQRVAGMFPPAMPLGDMVIAGGYYILEKVASGDFDYRSLALTVASQLIVAVARNDEATEPQSAEPKKTN